MRQLALTAVLAAGLALAAAPGAMAAPSCAEGPATEGATIVGTPCDDTIHAPRGITTVLGEGGNDTIFGGRGNESLFGGEGEDRLYGGIGDDRLRGGPGADLLSGGFGADSLDGEGGGDLVRGDATIDTILDSGGEGVDTLSYTTGVTPGFTNQGSLFEYSGFPNQAEGRGAYIDLLDEDETEPIPQDGFANDGLAPSGGGVDLELEGTKFERVIGTPFPDFIVGSPGAEQIYGGGGADVLIGEGGADLLVGGAEGDSCQDGPAATIQCETSAKQVTPRKENAIAVGVMTPGVGPPAVYLTGSSGVDRVSASYSASPPTVTFTLQPGSAPFDTEPSAGEGCAPPSGGQVVCALGSAPDTVLLAGLGGDDALSATGFPETTSVVVLGNESNDVLSGGAGEDVVIDGAGNDVVDAGAADDAVPNNGGTDQLHAGPGDDLFISNEVCSGDLLDGGEGVDNANWANFGSGVALDLSLSSAGLLGPGDLPQCGGGTHTALQGIEDLEGSNQGDALTGDAGPNQLLGRPGPDDYRAGAGNDSILANSGDADPLIDCGEGFDTAQIDFPQYGDATPINCESIYERPPNSFRPPDTPPAPTAPVTSLPRPTVPTTPRDRRAPGTRITHRPRRLVRSAARLRRVSFAFTADEPGSHFRCRVDSHPFSSCHSPRAYRVTTGFHAFAVYAIDRAGNRDRTAAGFSFRVVRSSDRRRGRR